LFPDGEGSFFDSTHGVYLIKITTDEFQKMHSNTITDELSFVARGREFLDQGDIASAVEYYSKAFDPESLDEPEARNFLIEARAYLSRKFLPEALESFEEAIIMGDRIQRRQAIEGITSIAEIRSRLDLLTQQLKAKLKETAGGKNKRIPGLSLISDQENILLISKEALAKLPERLTKGVRIAKLPVRLEGSQLPMEAEKCIPYSNEEDISYVVEVAKAILNYKEPAPQLHNHFETPTMTIGNHSI
jgi:tetratricopeptide (TPR) repeat protein